MSTHLRVASRLAAEETVTFDKLGIVGDGKTFDHKGVTNLQNAVDENGIVKLGNLPNGKPPQMLLGETVDWRHVKGQILTSERCPFPDGVGAPRFLWDGPPLGTMFLWDRIVSGHLEGFAFEDTDGVRAPVGIMVDVDGDQDDYVNDPAERGFMGSECVFHWLQLITHAPKPGTYVDINKKGRLIPAPVFISLSRTSLNNQENHIIDDIAGNGNGWGTAIYQGRSANCVATSIKNCKRLIGFEYGFFCDGGFFYMEEMNFTSCNWPLWLPNDNNQISTAHHIRGEFNKHWAYINQPLVSFDSKWDPESAVTSRVNASGTNQPFTAGFIHIGRYAQQVMLRGALDGGWPPNVPIFTFEDDAIGRDVDIKIAIPNNYPTTRKALGIDYASLDGAHSARDTHGDPWQSRGQLRFRTNAGIVRDLPTGILNYNMPATTSEYGTQYETQHGKSVTG